MIKVERIPAHTPRANIYTHSTTSQLERGSEILAEKRQAPRARERTPHNCVCPCVMAVNGESSKGVRWAYPDCESLIPLPIIDHTAH